MMALSIKNMNGVGLIEKKIDLGLLNEMPKLEIKVDSVITT